MHLDIALCRHFVHIPPRGNIHYELHFISNVKFFCTPFFPLFFWSLLYCPSPSFHASCFLCLLPLPSFSVSILYLYPYRSSFTSFPPFPFLPSSVTSFLPFPSFPPFRFPPLPLSSSASSFVFSPSFLSLFFSALPTFFPVSLPSFCFFLPHLPFSLPL